MKKNKLTMRDAKKIINFLSVRTDINEKDKTNELVAYATTLIYNKEFYEIDIKDRQKVLKEVLNDVNNILEKYYKSQNSKKNNDYIYISIDSKEYQSNPINIKLFYEINDMLLSSISVEKIAENVLYKIFSGVISIEKIDNIKENDAIYYEIIVEDVSNLIYRIVQESMKLTSYKNPLKNNFKMGGKVSELNEKIDKCLDTYNSDIYSIMLENYNKMPFEVDKESAIVILKLLNSLKASQIKREIKEEIDKINKNKELSNQTKIEALEQFLMELGGE